jgi:hypothetical protein
MHQTLLDFKIAETILLTKQRQVGPHEGCVRKECSHAHESIHMKWTDSRIEQVLVDVRGVATGLVPRWFRYVSN